MAQHEPELRGTMRIFESGDVHSTNEQRENRRFRRKRRKNDENGVVCRHIVIAIRVLLELPMCVLTHCSMLFANLFGDSAVEI